MRLQAWHVIVLIIAFILLFGWKNLPNAARSLGESMRVFKSEVDQMKDENAARKDKDVPELPESGEATGGDPRTDPREPRDVRDVRDVRDPGTDPRDPRA
ncbi:MULTISPECIES: Sec-independent protein translocase subunit TatA [unclassified Ornithinimicrobium]|uniref:Sec-independent protein translocase subunit TatA n=1 Tax=unclassified Ornithinimicrobium TaxID=2615080 RepID=UPI00385299C7